MTPPTPNTPPVSATAAATGFRWSSPVPYLFGGLAMMLILIACALVILVCSYKKPFSSSSSQNSSENNTSNDHEKQSMPEFRMELAPEMEPKIVIIMPGDLNPTYLAKPVPPANADEQV